MGRGEAGEHVLELFNPSGQLALSKEIYVDGQAKDLEIKVPSVPAGNYFL
jgi:hypothetical protein